MAGRLFSFISYYAKHLPEDEALRFLFDLDERLYALQGSIAIAYGKGLHPKHHLTGYHDFFVKRIHNTDKVLDIGCGNGALAYDIATKCKTRVTAIDSNEKNILHAKERYHNPNITYIWGNAPDDLPNKEYDVVVLSNVLEHIEKRTEFLSRIAHSVRPDRLLIRVPLFERDWRVPLKRELGVEWRLDKTHHIEYTIESFLVEIEQAGFHVSFSETHWGEIWSVAERV
ncbi:MAG: class I SAM-dependent methyltransferase [bacterium]